MNWSTVNFRTGTREGGSYHDYIKLFSSTANVPSLAISAVGISVLSASLSAFFLPNLCKQ